MSSSILLVAHVVLIKMPLLTSIVPNITGLAHPAGTLLLSAREHKTLSVGTEDNLEVQEQWQLNTEMLQLYSMVEH